MVSDEWPDEQSFLTFFGEASPEIEASMGAAGISSEPDVVVWHPGFFSRLGGSTREAGPALEPSSRTARLSVVRRLMPEIATKADLSAA
jgi:hypothetical protein